MKDYEQLCHGKTRVISCELRAESLKARVKVLKVRVKFKIASSNPRTIKSMKTQGDCFKSSSFPKIISPKLFGIS